jgi:uncharacterized protein YndB with AHSA1/START domain
MNETETGYHTKYFSKSIHIEAPSSAVWNALTHPDKMTVWMTETEIDILTDWKVGSPIVIRGDKYWTPFENKGIVLVFDPEKILCYTHLSSLSHLPDLPASYVVFRFTLEPTDMGTTLMIDLSNFPTESVYKHLVFYWGVTLGVLKNYVERNTQ